MEWLSAIHSKIKLQEGSTKRGISAVLTGGITLYLVFKGQPVDIDTIMQAVSSKVDFWIGVGLNVIGLLGIFIPDEPKTVKIELPSIDLVGRSLSAQAPQQGGVFNPADSVTDRHDSSNHEWVRDDAPEMGLQSRHKTKLDENANRDQFPDHSGWNG